MGRARHVVIPRLFDVNVLLALREAELAMTPTDAVARAAALASELPADAEASFVLQLVSVVPPDPAGTPRSEVRTLTPKLRAFATANATTIVPTLQRAALTPLLRDYLLASWTCMATSVGISTAAAAPSLPVNATPLLKYRMASCPVPLADALDDVVAAVPDFVEAAYLRARIPELTVTAQVVTNQRTRFAAAREALPTSASVTYSLGSLSQTVGDCRAAITYYDATLALRPGHEDAALQRIVCLGYQGRHENAINSATRAIDAGHDNMADALYWRAWNHRQLRQLPEARADVDRALGVTTNARTLTLAGIVKYDQKDLLLAERDLGSAIRMDRTQCIARWYLALVSFEREDWVSTGEDFAASAGCYRQSAEETEAQLERARAADLDLTFKTSQIAGFQAVIQEERSQEQASYLNAANGFIRSDNFARAREMLAGIPDSSMHAAGARELRRYLDELAPRPER